MRIVLSLLFLTFISFFLSAQIPFDTLQKVSSDMVFFDVGKYELRAASDSVLRLTIEKAGDLADGYIHITAHTDADGSNENNQLLSTNRGKAVSDFLLENGWSKDRIQINEFGEEKPIASNTTEDGKQLNRRATIDIYQNTKMVNLEGLVKDKETGEGIQADIVLRSKEWQDSIQTDPEGAFIYPVPINSVVGVDIYAEGYFFESQMLKAKPGETPPLLVELPKAKEGETVDIKNLYFVGDQAVLLRRSEPELPKVLKFLELNPEIRIEISGHINKPNAPPVAENTKHFILSVNRAKLVYDYLLDNGISESQVSFKGYGNSQMRYPKARGAKEQELNRRVEIRVLGSGENLGKIGKDEY